MDYQTQLQQFFRELFQFDLADLDFGLYRLFALKRAEIENFINNQLEEEVSAAFAEVSGADKARLQEEFDALQAEIGKKIAGDAILPTGELKPEYRNSGINFVRELAERYEQVRAQLQKIRVTEGHKAEVFNYLYAFFHRYYEDGDFIPKRRYGARESYAIPYNGEETLFHWANREQHYVKTGERFREYAFKLTGLLGEYRVRFTMTAASIARDNAKGKTRYFFPRPDLAEWSAESRLFTLPFEYRPPTPEEVEQYGKNSKAQEAILQESLPLILEAVPDDGLYQLLKEDQRAGKQIEADEPELPLLLKRLRHFCRRQTGDFFIHKNLRRFLEGELDFFIKDQVLHVMELETEDLAARRRIVRVFRRLALQIIQFLAHIEEAQKRLFEKKKFVLETDYLIPMQRVPESFWPEILANEAQLAEWRAWYALEAPKDLLNRNGEIDVPFLREQPALPLHTRHFDPAFTRRLLENLPFADLDEATDGLLIHGENYQALRLLEERYRKQVQCIHIDPPYNTETSGFLYKNSYQHSSWLAMLANRLSIGTELLGRQGSFLSHIDEYEFDNLYRLFKMQSFDYLGTLVWDKKNPMMGGKGIAIQHEHIIWGSYHNGSFNIDNENVKAILKKARGLVKKYGLVTDECRKEFAKWVRNNKNLSGGEKAYQYLDDHGRVYQSVGMSWPNPNPAPKEFFTPLIHPVTKKPCPVPPRGWSRSPQKMQELLERDEIIFGIDETIQPRRKIFLTETTTRPLSSVIQNGSKGKVELDKMGLEFSYGHPVSLYETLLFSALLGEDGIVLDFFAGSGTTGHAVINLNREDGGRRKFILAEMGEYFDTVLLPRIAKVMYAPEWKNGKPKRKATAVETERAPRLVKIIRLESYEDALHNLAATAVKTKDGERETAVKELVGGRDYLLRYWLEIPLQEAETTLRGFDLAHPFNYRLEIPTDDGPAFKRIDVVETFNYLRGLRPQKYETWRNPGDGGREYRVVKAVDREGKKRLLVIWRDMADYDPEKERAFLEDKLQEMETADESWDEILINGDTPTPGVASLDPLFKQLMMQEETA